MSNQYFLDRIAGRNPDLRAADADREAIAERLRQGHAEGRLDLAEFQQRLGRCYEARTVGELDGLVRDLPRQDDQLQHRSFGSSPLRRWRLAPLAPILIALIVISAAIGYHVFWLWIPVALVVWRISWPRRKRSWAAPRRGPDGWI
jgi:Domain of unknown function (DUF1707)